MKKHSLKNHKSLLFTNVFKILVLLMLCLFSTSLMNAQVKKDSELFKTLQNNDRLLFDKGLNKCDFSQFENLMKEDIEFFHDKMGVTKTKKQFIEALKKGPCRKGSTKPKRILSEDTLEVYALYDNGKLYGAIQTGIHFFGKSQAKFTHLWLSEKGVWKLSRVLSFEHKELPKSNKSK